MKERRVLVGTWSALWGRLRNSKNVPIGMVASKKPRRGFRSLAAFALISGLASVVSVTLGAQVASAGTCTTLEFPVSIAPGVFNAPVGTVLHFVVSTTLSSTDCPISGGTVTFTDPHGTVTPLVTGTGTVAPGTTMTWGTVDYTIVSGDIGTHGAPPGFVRRHATSLTAGFATEPSGAKVPQSWKGKPTPMCS